MFGESDVRNVLIRTQRKSDQEEPPAAVRRNEERHFGCRRIKATGGRD